MFLACLDCFLSGGIVLILIFKRENSGINICIPFNVTQVKLQETKHKHTKAWILGISSMHTNQSLLQSPYPLLWKVSFMQDQWISPLQMDVLMKQGVHQPPRDCWRFAGITSELQVTKIRLLRSAPLKRQKWILFPICRHQNSLITCWVFCFCCQVATTF